MQRNVFDDMVAAARTDKAEGNRLLSLRRHDAAYQAYCRGIAEFGTLRPEMLNMEAREFKAALCCSAAQAALLCDSDIDGNNGSATRALLMAELAMELVPGNLMALLRRGCAHAKKQAFDLACNDFQTILSLDPEVAKQGRATVRRLQHFARAELEKLPKETAGARLHRRPA